MIRLKSIPPPTLISEGSVFQGDLEFAGHALVFGLVEGDIRQNAPEPICIGKTGWIHGNVNSEGPVVVEGRVEGDISSNRTVRISHTGIVRGRIVSPKIEVQQGADVEGTILARQRHRNP